MKKGRSLVWTASTRILQSDRRFRIAPMSRMEILLTKRRVKPRAQRVVPDFALGVFGTLAAIWFLFEARRDLLSMNGDAIPWIGQSSRGAMGSQCGAREDATRDVAGGPRPAER